MTRRCFRACKTAEALSPAVAASRFVSVTANSAVERNFLNDVIASEDQYFEGGGRWSMDRRSAVIGRRRGGPATRRRRRLSAVLANDSGDPRRRTED